MKKEATRIVFIILSSFLSAFAVKGFVDNAHLYPAGFLGVAIFISNILKSIHIPFSYNFIYLILNIVSTFLVLKVAGKKLILYSILQYSFVSLFIYLLPTFSLVEDTILLAIFGGVIAGISCWLALEANASSGGADFLAIFFSHKFNHPCWNELMLFNVLILVLAGILFGFTASFYSIIYQFIVTSIINKLHTRYQLVTLHIVTNDPDPIGKMIFQKTDHSLTKIKAVGGYSGQDTTILYMVCSKSEVAILIPLIKKIDPKAFISEISTSKVFGDYKQLTYE